MNGQLRSASSGVDYLLAGFRMLRDPAILPFFLVPLVINMLIFTGAIYWSVAAFAGWSEYALGQIPEWLAWLEWVLWPLFILVILLVVFYTFTLVANLIASPFNGLLAERVAARMRPSRGPEITGIASFLATVPAALLREVRKLLYFAAFAILLIIALLIPVLSPFAPVLWFLFGAWSLALEYCDFQADNDGVDFGGLKARLQQQRGLSLGFGAATMVATMIPLLNLAVMPAAVCGATRMWVERLEP